MLKPKHIKKHIFELDPGTAAAIDKTVEAAISSRMEDIDSHIAQTIKNCLSEKVVDLNEYKTECKKLYCPDAGP